MRHKIHSRAGSASLPAPLLMPVKSHLLSLKAGAVKVYTYSLLTVVGVASILMCVTIGLIKVSFKALVLPVMVGVAVFYLLYQYLIKSEKANA